MRRFLPGELSLTEHWSDPPTSTGGSGSDALLVVPQVCRVAVDHFRQSVLGSRVGDLAAHGLGHDDEPFGLGDI
jgi:hypothetical protein